MAPKKCNSAAIDMCPPKKFQNFFLQRDNGGRIKLHFWGAIEIDTWTCWCAIWNFNSVLKLQAESWRRHMNPLAIQNAWMSEWSLKERIFFLKITNMLYLPTMYNGFTQSSLVLFLGPLVGGPGSTITIICWSSIHKSRFIQKRADMASVKGEGAWKGGHSRVLLSALHSSLFSISPCCTWRLGGS